MVRTKHRVAIVSFEVIVLDRLLRCVGWCSHVAGGGKVIEEWLVLVAD